MDEFWTEGITFYQGYRIPLTLTCLDENTAEIANNERYVVMFIKNGSGMLESGNGRLQYKAPCFVLLNYDIKTAVLAQNMTNSGFIIHYHPNVINSRFSFSNIEDGGSFSSISDSQDMFFLDPFLELQHRKIKIISIDAEHLSYINRRCSDFYNILNSRNTDSWPCCSRSHLIELLFFIRTLSSMKKSPETDELPNDLREIQLYLHSNYRENININRVVQKFATNKTTLNTRFRQFFKMSFKQYLIDFRLDISKSLLRSTGLNVQEICYRTGFRDIANFYRNFKNRNDLSPGEYRKKNYSL